MRLHSILVLTCRDARTAPGTQWSATCSGPLSRGRRSVRAAASADAVAWHAAERPQRARRVLVDVGKADTHLVVKYDYQSEPWPQRGEPCRGGVPPGCRWECTSECSGQEGAFCARVLALGALVTKAKH